jgi:hypothetical protein
MRVFHLHLTLLIFLSVMSMTAFASIASAITGGGQGRWALRASAESKSLIGAKYESLNGGTLTGFGLQLNKEASMFYYGVKYRYLVNNSLIADITDGTSNTTQNLSYASSQFGLGFGLRFGANNDFFRPYLGVAGSYNYESIKMNRNTVTTLNPDQLGYSSGYEVTLGTSFKLSGSNGSSKISAFLEASYQDNKGDFFRKNNFQFGGYLLTGGIEW